MQLLAKTADYLALTYAILYFPAPFFWLLIHPFIRFWRRFGTRSFWIALPVWMTSATMLLLLRHRIFAERFSRNLLTTIAGLILLGLGLWIGRRVHRNFGLKRLGGLHEMNPVRYGRTVVSHGIYARLRHPRYVEYMISFVGFALLTEAGGIFVLAIVTILMYVIVAPLEERELCEHYGSEYEAYTRAVPRFFPHLRPRARPDRRGSSL